MRKADIQTLDNMYNRFCSQMERVKSLQKTARQVLQEYSKQKEKLVIHLQEAEAFINAIDTVDHSQKPNVSVVSRQIEEIQQSFNQQYLKLQNQLQQENRSYTAISNLMKTRHDTAKNSISECAVVNTGR